MSKLVEQTIEAYRITEGDKIGKMVKNPANGKMEFVCNATVVKKIKKDGGIVLETDAWTTESSRGEKFTVWRIKP